MPRRAASCLPALPGLPALLLAVVAVGGCGRTPPKLSLDGGAAGSAAGTGGGGSSGSAGSGVDAGPGPDGAAGTGVAVDPGRVLMHRLTNVEYDNSVKDLLGVTTSPAADFQRDEVDVDEATGGFDNLAENLHTFSARYQQYFDAAKKLANAVWADPMLQARILTCAPDATGQCARTIITTFGLRAWRRPLTATEVATLGTLADSALKETGDFPASIKRVVTAMLSSLPFLYKIELDPNPDSTAPHLLSGYELASRLSYFLWSSMPDDDLLKLGDGLLQGDVLDAQLERMLAHPRSAALTRDFAGQWLGLRELEAHDAATRIYPTWDADLRKSLSTEMSLYFAEFLDRSFDDFLTADLNFVDRRLATHYLVRGEVTEFERLALLPLRHLGFLGLAGFQTLTSPAYRTSPSQRGSWIAQHLLCETQGRSPHGGGPPSIELDGFPVDTRKALTNSLNQASCAACHATFDGMGFAFEVYDGIGSYRSYYSPTQPIDTSGTLPDGTKFADATGLAAALAHDPRVPTCATRKALSYAVGRVLDDDDRARVTELLAVWRGGSLRELLRAVVFSDAFRSRRGERP